MRLNACLGKTIKILTDICIACSDCESSRRKCVGRVGQFVRSTYQQVKQRNQVRLNQHPDRTTLMRTLPSTLLHHYLDVSAPFPTLSDLFPPSSIPRFWSATNMCLPVASSWCAVTHNLASTEDDSTSHTPIFPLLSLLEAWKSWIYILALLKECSDVAKFFSWHPWLKD